MPLVITQRTEHTPSWRTLFLNTVTERAKQEVTGNGRYLPEKLHHNCAVCHIKDGEIGGTCSVHATFWSENLKERVLGRHHTSLKMVLKYTLNEQIVTAKDNGYCGNGNEPFGSTEGR